MRENQEEPLEKQQTQVVLNEAEAASYLGLSRATLRRGRMQGRRAGYCSTPAFIRMGRAIRYLRDDLDKFLAEHRVIVERGQK